MGLWDVEFKVGGSFPLLGRLRDTRKRPLDLSGAQKVTVGFRPYRTQGDPVLTAEMTIVNPAAGPEHPERGQVYYLITADDSIALGEGEFDFDFVVDWGDENPTHHPGGRAFTLKLRDAVVT